MDKQVIALLIPITALMIPVAAIVMNGLKSLAKTRLEHERLSSGAGNVETETELAELREELGEMRAEFTDVHERLDFTERLLTQARETGRLSDGQPG